MSALACLELEKPTRTGLLKTVAEQVADALRRHTDVSRADLSAWMSETFGATDADGAWSMRDAYDALEIGQVLLQTEDTRRLLDRDVQRDVLAELIDFASLLPTQTYRSEQQIALQQFSTPMPIAYLAAVAAGIRPDDAVLEPSAGTGMLAVHAANAGATLLLNELDDHRADLLEAALGRRVIRHDGATIADRALQTTPTAVLINPPFSRSANIGDDAHAGARHLIAALNALATGGRCVAIMPAWFAPDESGRDGYRAVERVETSCFDVLLQVGAFARHGTSIGIRMLVYDRGRNVEQAQRTGVARLQDMLELIEQLPPRMPIGPRASESSPVERLAKRSTPARSLMAARTSTPLIPPRIASTSPLAVDLAYMSLEQPRPAGEPVGLYVPYRIARIEFEAAREHPTPLVESIAMASIAPPPVRYVPKLPAMTVGALSAAQLETLCYAGQAFEQDVPGRFKLEATGKLVEHDEGFTFRAGYFLGDGTGAGKGRQVAGIIMDRWLRGERRHIWVSRSASLLEDAQRDWRAVGGVAIDIRTLTDWALGATVEMPEGILFTTYGTLRSERADKGSRLDQIITWASTGKEAEPFNGLIVFDESHAMANAAGGEGARGPVKGSEQGVRGIALQNALSRARVLYVSATGASDINNLAYATRLGIYGPGTAFATREIFVQQMREGGTAALELVARDLKALGRYTSRALSFDGVEYDVLEHALTPAQIEIYDIFCEAWRIIHVNLDAVLKETAVVDPIDGRTLNGQVLGAALSRFESTKQRFFAQLLMSMKLPSLLRAIEQDLAAGRAAVVQLVSTAEAMLDRRLADLDASDRAELAIELSPREYVVDYLTTAFPIRAMETYSDSEGELRSRPASDEDGNPLISQVAVKARDELIEKLCALPSVCTALDELIGHFGVDTVAEVTGRTRRLIMSPDGQQKLESRSARTNLAETAAFQHGDKQILVFSDAGGTGRSYHADLTARNQARRVHYLLEPGWRADAAIQGLGRSHRTHQASAPLFRPMTTDVKGEKRFISTIARRLDSLGALTRGQRQTGGQNLFDPADNLESDYAKEALSTWYRLLYEKKLECIGLDEFCAISGLKLLDENGGGLKSDLPPIQRWLNRLLAFPIALQNRIFDDYFALVQSRVEALKEAGRLDVGVETIAAEKIVEVDNWLLRTDPLSGAETRLLRLELHRKPWIRSLHRLMERKAEDPHMTCMRNSRSKRVAMVEPGPRRMMGDGAIVRRKRLLKPTDDELLTIDAFEESNWEPIDEAEFREAWVAEAAAASERMHVETVNLATGLLLPIWHRLPKHWVEVWRVADGRGVAHLGRLIPDESLAELGKRFDVEMKVLQTPAMLLEALTRQKTVDIDVDLKLRHARVNDKQRYELIGFSPSRLDWFKSLGCFSEVIAYKTRLFAPPERVEEIIGRLIDTDDALNAVT